jgi:nucleotidyltransferase substrate binding protein (TIGR01987 family)
MEIKTLLDDFEQAIAQFDLAIMQPASSDVVKAGCIQYFEFCFELAWKSIKKMAEESGVSDCVAPRQSLKYAFSCGWIANEETWLGMLAARNQMSHTYDAKNALKIYQSLASYAPEFRTLLVALKKNQ